MSKFFEDVGDVLSFPIKESYDIITGNPKANSVGDIFNNTVGPGNPFQQLIEDNPINQGYKSVTGGDLAAPFQAPTWQDLGKPGQAFAENIDQTNKILPSSFQPYAEPVEAIGLGVFDPFAGAAFQTAYEAGQEQTAQKGFDWGELGKNAAINFGTAGVADIAKNALTAANVTNATKAGVLNNFGVGSNTLENAFAASNTPDALASVGANFAPGETAAALGTNSAQAFNAIPGAVSAVDSFNPNLIGSSNSIIPQANSLASSGQNIVDSAYQASLKGLVQTLANNVLTSTLAPQSAQPISSFDGFSTADDTNNTSGSQYGDILNAFGGGEVNTANPNGPRINEQAFNDSVNRLASNAYLQENQARDVSLPAGQYQPEQNTPYANQLTGINNSTTQAYADLLDETNNANAYYSIIDSNPGLTSDQLNTYLTDPSTGVLGNFSVTPNAAQYLQGIRPLGPMNSSLL